jgi:NAD(P)-dependent dehydrogenase (short-subunit alcohol dehydrogenase family)
MDMTPEEVRRVVAVAYFGHVHGPCAALRRMLPRDRGAIVLIGSALAAQEVVGNQVNPVPRLACARRMATASERSRPRPIAQLGPY